MLFRSIHGRAGYRHGERRRSARPDSLCVLCVLSASAIERRGVRAEAERVAEKSPTAIVHAVEEIPTPRGVIMKTTWGMGMHITMITLNTGTARARV